MNQCLFSVIDLLSWPFRSVLQRWPCIKIDICSNNEVPSSVLKLLSILFFCGITACNSNPYHSEKTYYSPGAHYPLHLGAGDISPDGRLAAISGSSVLWVVDLESQETLVTAIDGFSFSPVGGNTLQWISTDTLVYPTSSGLIKVWDAKEDNLLREIDLPGSPRITSLTWSSSGNTLAVGTLSGSIILVSVFSEQLESAEEVYDVGYPIFDLEFSADGSLLLVGGEDADVQILNTESRTVIGALPVGEYVADLQIFGERQLMTAGESISVWEYTGQEKNIDITDPSMAGQIMANIAGTVLLVGVAALGSGGYAGFPTGNLTRGNRCFRAAAVSPEGNILVDVHPGISKEVIRIIDLDTEKVIKSLNPRGSSSCSVGFSPDGRKLLILTDRVASLYDTDTWDNVDLNLASTRVCADYDPITDNVNYSRCPHKVSP